MRVLRFPQRNKKQHMTLRKRPYLLVDPEWDEAIRMVSRYAGWFKGIVGEGENYSVDREGRFIDRLPAPPSSNVP